MTALVDLLSRADGPEPVLGPDDVADWPAGTLARFAAAGLVAEAGPAAAVRCPGCDHDHVEPVRWAEGVGRARRAFVTCPEAGLVPLTPASLRRWAVRLTSLARAVAGAVGVAGEPAEVVPGRVWRLGPVRTTGRAWVGYLAIGLGRPDGSAVVAEAARAWTAPPVVLVPGPVPPAAVWPTDRRPVVVPLADLLTLGPDGLAADRVVLHSLLAPAGVVPIPAPPVLAVPADTLWEHVALAVEDHHLTVRVGGTVNRIDFAAAGFEDRRKTGVPDARWALLRLFAGRGGELEPPDAVRTKTGALKQGVSDLRGRLRGLLGIPGDPFHRTRKTGAYRCRFTIRVAGGASFPTPPGATWDDVTLTAAGPEAVRVAVRAAAAWVVIVPADDPGSAGRYEAATAEGEKGGRYTLSDLGLVGDDGRSTAAAGALVAVLRAGGRVTRPPDDPAMLALGKALTDFFRLDGSPFDFHPARTWVARFGVGVPSPDGHR